MINLVGGARDRLPRPYQYSVSLITEEEDPRLGWPRKIAFPSPVGQAQNDVLDLY